MNIRFGRSRADTCALELPFYNFFSKTRLSNLNSKQNARKKSKNDLRRFFIYKEILLNTL